MYRNILLDRLPTEYEGYLIRTDYRIGIQITQCLSDNELTHTEQIYNAFLLLYGNGIPSDIDLAYNGLIWFINGGIKEDNGDEPNNVKVFDFDVDCNRIQSAFRRYFNIDIKSERMHWFEFISLLNDVGECALSSVIEYRSADISKMDKEEKKFYRKMKRKYGLQSSLSPEEQEAIDKVKKMFNKEV